MTSFAKMYDFYSDSALKQKEIKRSALPKILHGINFIVYGEQFSYILSQASVVSTLRLLQHDYGSNVSLLQSVGENKCNMDGNIIAEFTNRR